MPNQAGTAPAPVLIAQPPPEPQPGPGEQGDDDLLRDGQQPPFDQRQPRESAAGTRFQMRRVRRVIGQGKRRVPVGAERADGRRREQHVSARPPMVRLARPSQKAAKAAWMNPPTRRTCLDHAAAGVRSAAFKAADFGVTVISGVVMAASGRVRYQATVAAMATASGVPAARTRTRICWCPGRRARRTHRPSRPAPAASG